eukprot:1374498-Pleurochrysis_carterae.AAC.1
MPAASCCSSADKVADAAVRRCGLLAAAPLDPAAPACAPPSAKGAHVSSSDESVAPAVPALVDVDERARC